MRVLLDEPVPLDLMKKPKPSAKDELRRSYKRSDFPTGFTRGKYAAGLASGSKRAAGGRMRNEFTAVVERAGRWYIAYCPEIPGANGQGRTKAAALKSLGDAIALILEDRRKDGLRGVPASARRERVIIG